MPKEIYKKQVCPKCGKEAYVWDYGHLSDMTYKSSCVQGFHNHVCAEERYSVIVTETHRVSYIVFATAKEKAAKNIDSCVDHYTLSKNITKIERVTQLKRL